MTKIFDFAIFGGGIVGSAIFNKLTRLGKKCVLIEIAEDVCTGVSKANSALVHSGFDAKQGSLKAKLNVRGNFLMPQLCKRLKVDFKHCGAVVVGNSLEKIEQLYSRGIQNGVPSDQLEILKNDSLHALVPNLKKEIMFGLHAKNAGIVNVFMLNVALAEEAVINGAECRFGFETSAISSNNNIFSITNGKETIHARQVINASGTGYNDIAKLLGSEQKKLSFRRGQYYVLNKDARNFVPLTVFPLPTEKGKGILATPTTDGNILFGPTAEELENYNTETTASGFSDIEKNINTLFDNVPFNQVIRQFSGVRIGCGEDFVIEKSKQVSGVINICGINSPGLSASPAIAEYVCQLLGLDNEKEIANLLERSTYNSIATKSSREIESLIQENAKYGNIICKCEMVSEQEILNAIHSPLKPHTLDGIKRRVRTMAGQCQGGFCTMKVAQIIARELAVDVDDVIKENKTSNLCFPKEIL